MSEFVYVARLEHAKDLPLPAYGSAGASGADLFAAVTETIILLPGQRKVIPTGITLAIKPGFEGQIRPRSGLAASHGVTVLNSPGTIDADYRGEVGVILINHGDSFFVINRGMRIAQLIIAPVVRIILLECEDGLPKTVRGADGFGSTGV